MIQFQEMPRQKERQKDGHTLFYRILLGVQNEMIEKAINKQVISCKF